MKTAEPGWRPEYRGADPSHIDADPVRGLDAPSSPGLLTEEGCRA